MHVGLLHPECKANLRNLQLIYIKHLAEAQKLRTDNETVRQGKATAESTIKNLRLAYVKQLAENTRLKTELEELRQSQTSNELTNNDAISKLTTELEGFKKTKSTAEGEINRLKAELVELQSNLQTNSLAEVQKLRQEKASAEHQAEKVAEELEAFKNYHRVYQQEVQGHFRRKQAELYKSRKDQQHFVELATTTGIKRGRYELQRQVELAWSLVPGNRPFGYFQKRLTYAEKRLASSHPRSEPIPEFVDSDEEHS